MIVYNGVHIKSQRQISIDYFVDAFLRRHYGPLIEEGDVNKVMRKIEADIRKNLDVFMPDTHFVIDGDDEGIELVQAQAGR